MLLVGTITNRAKACVRVRVRVISRAINRLPIFWLISWLLPSGEEYILCKRMQNMFLITFNNPHCISTNKCQVA